ncbi:MAG: cyclic nucleotide-binding domain-containing protein [Lewinella sp.]|nr:cyclic nucleotide-binding domain-containing protein [Lewinella sp.]
MADEAIEHLLLIVEGEYVVRMERQGRKRELGVWGAGYPTGLLPFSRMERAGANGIALRDTKVLEMPRAHLRDLVKESYTLTENLVGVMTSRVRDFQQMRLMDEKLMALGKMSAGLAHELNNPIAAVVRASQELKKQIRQTPESFKAVITMRVTPQATDQLNEVLFPLLDNYGKGELSLLETEALKDELQDWLEDHGVGDAEDLADTLIDFGFAPQQLEQIAGFIPEDALEPVIKWVETNLVTERLTQEIAAAATRVGGLVQSIKAYSYMDVEPSLEEVDLHEGIKSTLTMLQYRFKKQAVKLEKLLDSSLPTVKALAGELNQVWTNLMVNALDAMPAVGGLLTLRSYQQRESICVEIEDNGGGVPTEIQSRIFEPFFTTKGINEGTGMGLDIVRRIVGRHGGEVSMSSQPGQTIFKVCFPIYQAIERL